MAHIEFNKNIGKGTYVYLRHCFRCPNDWANGIKQPRKVTLSYLGPVHVFTDPESRRYSPALAEMYARYVSNERPINAGLFDDVMSELNIDVQRKISRARGNTCGREMQQ